MGKYDSLLSMLASFVPKGEVRTATTAFQAEVQANKTAEAAFVAAVPTLRSELAKARGGASVSASLEAWLQVVQNEAIKAGEKRLSLATDKLRGAVQSNRTAVDKALKGIISMLPSF